MVVQDRLWIDDAKLWVPGLSLFRIFLAFAIVLKQHVVANLWSYHFEFLYWLKDA